MAQYSSVKSGSLVSVTNGSNIVTGSGSDWLGKISVGDGFTVAGDGVIYDVASVDSDTQITLSVNYAGTTGTGLHYTIHRDFTTPDNIPELSNGDIETGTIMKRLARVVQNNLTSLYDLHKPVYTNNAATGTITLDTDTYEVFEIETSGNITITTTALPSNERVVATLFVKNTFGGTVTLDAKFKVADNFAGFGSTTQLIRLDLVQDSDTTLSANWSVYS